MIKVNRYTDFSKPFCEGFLKESGYDYNLDESNTREKLDEIIDIKLHDKFREQENIYGISNSLQKKKIIKKELCLYIINNNKINESGRFDFQIEIFKSDRKWFIKLDQHGF